VETDSNILSHNDFVLALVLGKNENTPDDAPQDIGEGPAYGFAVLPRFHKHVARKFFGGF
jgi:hypothetical protein